jgi:hypothetical protein
MCSAIDSFFQFGILFTAFALEGDGFPMLTVTFNSQCVTDRVKLSGYRKFWLVKEKAEKKLKISITHIHFKFKTKYPATKTKKKKPFLAYGALRHHQWVPQFASV